MSSDVQEEIEYSPCASVGVDRFSSHCGATVFLTCASVATAVASVVPRDGLEQGLFIAGSVLSAVFACLYGVSARRNWHQG